MKIILFDLGNTLEDQERSGLLPGASETLEVIQAMHDANGNAPVLALVLLDLAALRWGVDSRDWTDERRDW